MEILLLSYYKSDESKILKDGTVIKKTYIVFNFENDSSANEVYMHMTEKYHLYSPGTDITECVQDGIFEGGTDILGMLRLWTDTGNDTTERKEFVVAYLDYINLPVLIRLIQEEFPGRFLIRTAFRCIGVEQHAIPDTSLYVNPTGRFVYRIVTLDRMVIA